MTEAAGISPALHELAQLARSMVPPSVGVGVTDPKSDAPSLFDEEMAATAGMVPKRLREFKAGRHAIRQAMRELGVTPQAIRMGPDRAPIWPKGVSGSLAHSEKACIALITSGQAAIGVDVEESTPLATDLIGIVCNEEERHGFATKPSTMRAAQAKRIFCAKEAVYKAQYKISQQVIDFEALTVGFSTTSSAFSARFRRDVGSIAAGWTVDGQIKSTPDFIVTTIIF